MLNRHRVLPWLFGSIAVLGLLLETTAAHAQVDPSKLYSDYCPVGTPVRSITLRANDRSTYIPLPHTYANDSNQTVTFTTTMNANRIFGNSVVVQSYTLEPGLEVTVFDDGIWATSSTPVESDRVTISVTSNKTGSTVLYRCEFDVTVTRTELCNGIDDDGDGRIDEDAGSCAERYLFVPLCWRGSNVEFADQVDRLTKYFYNRMHLNSCAMSALDGNRAFWHAGVGPSVHNWCPSGGIAEDVPSMTEAMAQLRASKKVDLREYDTVMFLTDTPSAQPCVAGYTDMKGLVFARSGYPGFFGVFSHEYGHILRLSDEYFDPPSPEIKNPSTGKAYNRLTADLGCNPQTCCSNPHPCPAHSGHVCLGNLAAKLPASWQWGDPTPSDFRNGRCIMSNASAPGYDTTDPTGVASERDWCPRCIAHLNQVAPRCSQRYTGDKRRLELNGHVSSSGQILLAYYELGEGRVGLAQDQAAGETEVEVTDPANGQRLDLFPVQLAGDEPGSCPSTSYFWRRKAVAPEVRFPVALKVQRAGTILSQVTAGGSAPNAQLASVTQECTTAAGAVVWLDASGSSDPDGDTLFFQWSAADATLLPEGAGRVSGSFAPGKHSVSVMVSDGTGANATASAEVNVVDTTPPQFPTLANAIIMRCNSGEGSVSLTVPTATDPCSSSVPVTGRITASTNPTVTGTRVLVDGTVQLPIGRHTVEWTAKDDAGNQATANQTVEVIPAMVALNGIRSASNVKLTTANGFAAIVALGNEGIWIEPDTKIGDAWSLANIELRDRVSVGWAYASGQIHPGNNLTISGGLRSGLPTWTIPRLNVSTTFPSTGLGSLRLDSGRSAPLYQGNYSEVSVSSNATVYLEAGDYKIKSLTLESGSKMVLPSTGRTRIMVENQAILRGAVSGQARLLLGYFGSNELQVETSLRGQVFAPNARVTIKASGAGTLTAKGLNFEPGVVYECRADALSMTDWTDK